MSSTLSSAPAKDDVSGLVRGNMLAAAVSELDHVQTGEQPFPGSKQDR